MVLSPTFARAPEELPELTLEALQVLKNSLPEFADFSKEDFVLVLEQFDFRGRPFVALDNQNLCHQISDFKTKAKRSIGTGKPMPGFSLNKEKLEYYHLEFEALRYALLLLFVLAKSDNVTLDFLRELKDSNNLVSDIKAYVRAKHGEVGAYTHQLNIYPKNSGLAPKEVNLILQKLPRF